jgi:hypothetical protein
MTATVSKARGDGGLSTAVLSCPQCPDPIAGDEASWEAEPMPGAASGELMVFEHDGFWHLMDTLRDKNYPRTVEFGKAPWITWQVSPSFWHGQSVFVTGHTGSREDGCFGFMPGAHIHGASIPHAAQPARRRTIASPTETDDAPICLISIG